MHTIIGQLSFNKRLLICETYYCHTSEVTRAEATRMCLKTVTCALFLEVAPSTSMQPMWCGVPALEPHETAV